MDELLPHFMNKHLDPDGLDGVFDLMRAPVDAVQIGQEGEPGGDLAALQRIQQHLTDELDLQLAVQVQLAWRGGA